MTGRISGGCYRGKSMSEQEKLKRIDDTSETGNRSADRIEKRYVIAPCGHGNNIEMSQTVFECETCKKTWVIKQ